jgi:circadian clock protein KaiC
MDFRESLYRMISALTGAGVTILSTIEVEESFQNLDFSEFSISFLTDDVIWCATWRSMASFAKSW